MRTNTLFSTVMFALVMAASLALPDSARAVYPNPFKDGDVVKFQLSMPKTARIKIQVFDLIGRPVRVLWKESEHPEGNFDIEWDGRDESGTTVIAGIYICVLFSDGVAVKSVKVVKIGFQ
ncbi:MAG: T9SS type A sorting domain-containing protein [bacterium]|nr:T9SS type A sorting domain-containing protein [Candidatus Kapabacteria bacterium]